MAHLGGVRVPCPECQELVRVPVVTRTSTGEDGELLVHLAPDMGPYAEHYAAEHVGASVEP